MTFFPKNKNYFETFLFNSSRVFFPNCPFHKVVFYFIMVLFPVAHLFHHIFQHNDFICQSSISGLDLHYHWLISAYRLVLLNTCSLNSLYSQQQLARSINHKQQLKGYEGWQSCMPCYAYLSRSFSLSSILQPCTQEFALHLQA